MVCKIKNIKRLFIFTSSYYFLPFTNLKCYNKYVLRECDTKITLLFLCSQYYKISQMLFYYKAISFLKLHYKRTRIIYKS